MAAINQTRALEAASQRLAAHTGRDCSNIRMVDHYLKRIRRPDPAIVALVTEADAIVRPLIDAATDLEAECDLLRHRLRVCRTEGRNLVDYVRAMPDRLPEQLNGEWAGVELATWLRGEVERAPFPTHEQEQQQ